MYLGINFGVGPGLPDPPVGYASGYKYKAYCYNVTSDNVSTPDLKIFYSCDESRKTDNVLIILTTVMRVYECSYTMCCNTLLVLTTILVKRLQGLSTIFFFFFYDDPKFSRRFLISTFPVRANNAHATVFDVFLRSFRCATTISGTFASVVSYVRLTSPVV